MSERKERERKRSDSDREREHTTQDNTRSTPERQ
jgi:hypothetical protein